ncbi:MAG: ImmA/IrrE family metallo-endopeptidase [Solobacterium sp.]|nr:ImmA/IrrE family metallo-endopeptidase [Solobacterium sp.]
MRSKAAKLAEELIRLYDTRDPFRLASYLDIAVKYINTKRQKGFCVIFEGLPFIFVNRNMSEQMQRMICAHELGHILLHKDVLSGNRPLLEYELFNIQNSAEYEANAFAADLLIRKAELRELLNEGNDVVSAASCLDVNVNLLMIRMIEMQKEGETIDLPFVPERKFLGRIRDDAGDLR